MTDASASDEAEAQDVPAATATSTPAQARPRWRTFVRGVVFVAIVAFFWSGIAVRQLAKINNHYVPAWVMFGGAGVGRTQVEYWIPHDDGERTIVDAYEVLELERSKDSPFVFRVKGNDHALRLGKRLCRVLKPELGPDLDLRMRTRTATRTKWREVAKGRENVCTYVPKKRKKRKKKRKKKGKSKTNSK